MYDLEFTYENREWKKMSATILIEQMNKYPFEVKNEHKNKTQGKNRMHNETKKKMKEEKIQLRKAFDF